MLQRLLHILFIALALLGSVNVFAQETEVQVKERANKLFDNQEYVAATSDFLKLLALQPRSPEYNYKYGTCLLFNSRKKSEAIKYLEFATASGGVDIEAFYYMGKAYHLNYQFEEAIKFYGLYKTNSRGKPNKELEVDRQLEMCENGRRLLKKITDIVVLEKKEYAYAEFYALYDLKDFGGDILVSSKDQSKLDKKKGFIPIVHFPPNAQKVYFASYGENEANGKQIYVKKKLPEGGWSVPELVKGLINTPFDEDFPYLDPSGEYLYFSSKGHNSMGGFDVFKSRYDKENDAFGPPENVDFAISSADNDLFYIVDSLDKNAWFASSRQSQDGKICVYKVRVERLSTPIAAIAGTFASEVHPDNKKFNIEVKDLASGRQIGTFFSQNDGSYLIALPKGGKYEYSIKITGTPQVFKAVVNVPQLSELKPLKQQISHLEENGKEVVKVIDLFDQTVENAEGLLAQIVQMRSELNPNASQFDLQALDNPAGKEVLSDLGMQRLSPLEAKDKMLELAKSQSGKSKVLEDVQQKAIAKVVDNAAEIKNLQAEFKNKVNTSNATSDPAEKYEIYTEAEKKAAKITALEQENQKLLKYSDSLTKVIQAGSAQANTAKKLEQQLSQAADDAQIIKVIGENKSQLKTWQEDTRLPAEKLVQEVLKLKSERDQLTRSRDSYQSSASGLQNEISSLENKLNSAKAKDKPGIQSSIDAKKNEQELINSEIRSLDKKIEKITTALDQKEDQLEFMQNVQKEKAPSKTLAPAEAQKAVQSTENQNYKTLKSYVAQQKAELEKNPVIAGKDPVETGNPQSESSVSVMERISPEHTSRLAKIENDPELTEEERLQYAQAEDEKLKSKVQDEIRRVEQTVKQDPSDAKAKETLKSLQEIETQTNERIAQRDEQITASGSEPAKTVSAETIVKELKPALDKRMEEIANNPNLSVIEQLKMAQNEELEFEGTLSNEIEVLEAKVKQDPSDQKAKSQLKTLQNLKKQVSESIDNRSLAIESLDPDNNVKVEKPTKEEVLTNVKPGHEARLNEIQNNPDLGARAKLEQLQAEDEKLLAATETEIKRVESVLKKNPNDAQTQASYETLLEIREETNTRIASRKEALSRPEIVSVPENTTPENGTSGNNPTASEVVAKVKPNHEQKLTEIANDDLLSPQEKQNKLIQEEVKLQKALDAEIAKTNKILAKNPSDEQALAQKTQLEATKEQSENRQSESQQVLVAEEKSLIKPTELFAKTDKNYQLDIQKIENGDAPDETAQLIAREKASQEILKAQLAKNEAQLAKKDNPSLAAQNQVLNELIDASEKRVESVSGAVSPENGNPEVNTPETQKPEVNIQNVRNAKMGQNASAMTDNPTTPEALQKQAKTLRTYESEVNKLIADNQKALAKDPQNAQLLAERDAYQQEKQAVIQKQEAVQRAIQDPAVVKVDPVTDPVNQTVQTPKNTNSEFSDHPDMRALQKEQTALQEKLNDPATTEREKAVLKKEIAANEVKQTKVENSLMEEKIKEQSASTLAAVQSSQATISTSAEAKNREEATLKSIQASEQNIAAQLKAAKSEKDPVVRQQLLDKALAQQETNETKLGQLKVDQVLNKSVQQLQESNPGTTFYELESKKDLENRRRRGMIEIGELSSEIDRLNEEIKSSSRSAAKPLIAERDAKTAELAALREEQVAVETALSKRNEQPAAVFSETAINEPISYEKEREIASSEPYKKYAKTAQEAQVIQKSIREKEQKLEDLKSDNLLLITEDVEKQSTQNQAQTTENLQKIASLTKEIETEKARLAEKKQAADQIINESEDPMKLQNLVARGVEPIKIMAVATLVPLPSNGFEIVNNPATAPVKTNIPVGVDVPSGLVYRVQVGAFAKPVKEELFKEFNPVSGEKMNSGITRYMAGYFNNRNAVMNARNQIQALGYTDAFPVAYCDGERISMQEARRLEESGQCVPLEVENLVMQASENVSQVTSPTTSATPGDTVRKELPPANNPGAYNQAPGAAKAIAVETRPGLFFTVQIGVYNKPVPATQIKNMEPLITKRLANGQIRYSAGIFQSVEGAQPKKREAIARGIADAYITAYYKGERISLDEARKLLSELGNGILEKENQKENKIVAEDKIKQMEKDNQVSIAKLEAQERIVNGYKEDQIQFVSKKTYAEYPRELMKRFNETGSFFYDANDQKIKSIVYKNEDYVPQVYYFRKEMDTVFIPKSDTVYLPGTYEITARMQGAQLSGETGEWLIRMGYQREIRRVDDHIRVRIFGIKEEAVFDELMNRMKALGFSDVIGGER